MKLLIITQKVNSEDPILGFFHRWIEEFAKHCEKVTVICLEKGKYDLPENVKVLSLGKERGNSKFDQVMWFYQHIWDERHNYDKVFVHMNQIYIILGGLLWRLMKKKVGLWYTHKEVSLSLRVATFLTDYIFTASDESFRIETLKKNIMGHGIDTVEFSPGGKSKNKIPQILTVGRVSRVKNIDFIIDVITSLNNDGFKADLTVVGPAITSDDMAYKILLEQKILDLGMEDHIHLLGSVPHKETPNLYRKSDVFINLSDTGSIDKVVLEAMACGLNVITSNMAFKDIVTKDNLVPKDLVIIKKRIKELLAEKHNEDKVNSIKQNHSLENLIPRIIKVYKA